MNRFLKKFSCKTRAYNTPRVPVQDNLAISPSQMNEMTKAGIPISSQMLDSSNFDDGVLGISVPDVPIEYRRGVTISDIYDYQQRSRSAVSSAAINQK